MKFPVIQSVAVVALSLSALGAYAADANVTNNVIVGTGIANGGFTVNNTTNGNVEVGLRARERYGNPVAGVYSPTGVTNSNGSGSYNQATGGFTPGAGASGTAGGTRAAWNFDWSINTDPSGTSGSKVNAFTYRLGMDFDASFNTNYQIFDLINGANPSAGGLALWDHSFGNNGTAQSAGVELALDTVPNMITNYGTLKSTSNLVQNSWNYDFFDGGSFPFDPTANGNYNIFLEVIDGNSRVVSRSDIQVVVGTGFVPEPGSLALVGAALAGLALSRRRKQ